MDGWIGRVNERRFCAVVRWSTHPNAMASTNCLHSSHACTYPQTLYCELPGNTKKSRGGWFGRGKASSSSSKGSVSRVERTAQKEFKKAVRELEMDYEDLKMCNEFWKNYNPFVSYGKLVLGVLGALLSFLWVLHIILYLLIRTPYPNVGPISTGAGK
jgi:hypothetical protein